MCGEKKMGKKWERRNKGSNWQWKENKFRKTTTASQFQTDQKKVMYSNSRKWMEAKRAWKKNKDFFFSAGFCSLEYVVFFSIGLNDLTLFFFFFIVSTSLCNDSQVGRPCWNGGEEQPRDNCHSSCMYYSHRLPGAERLNTSEITSQLALAYSCMSELLAMSSSRTNGLQLTWAIESLSSFFSFSWDHT